MLWLRFVLATSVGAFCSFAGPTTSFAFNLGYHRDITWDVLRAEGFNHDARAMVLVGNEFSDIFQADESFNIIDDDIKDEAKSLAGRLHFDQLYRPELIDENFRQLVRNARSTIQSNHAASNLTVAQGKLLFALGISLHVIQDFYAHSNWAELEVPEFSGAPEDATYFDIIGAQPDILQAAIDDYVARGEPRTGFGLFTHMSSDRVNVAGQPGVTIPNPVPKHSDLCKDWATRAHFDEAYRAAYKASLQWVRFFKHIIVDTAPGLGDPQYWENLTQFSQAANEADLDDVHEFAMTRGTAHFLALYGGAWKHTERWTDFEIAFQNLPVVEGFGLFNQIGEPFLWGEWRTAAEEISRGLFEAQAIAANIDDVPVAATDANFTCSVNPALTFGALPSTTNPQISDDIEWMATEAMFDYQPNWLKLAAPFVRDNDDGDGWFNINDEDPGGPSDYYVIWQRDRQSAPPGDFVQNFYYESPMRGRAQSFPNWQFLTPMGTSADASVNVQLWDSDDSDLFDQFLDNLPYIDLDDDIMDISPSDSSETLRLDVVSEPFAVLARPDINPQARPYGALIETSGHDDNTFSDDTASMTLQASKGLPTTKVRLTILEVSGGSYFPTYDFSCPTPNAPPVSQTSCGTTTQTPALSPFGCVLNRLTCNAVPVTCNGQFLNCVPPFLRSMSCGARAITQGADVVSERFTDGGITASATVNEYVLRNTDGFGVVLNNAETPPFGQAFAFDVTPNWQMSYEGYVDADTIPISFEINGSAHNTFRLPQNGRFELLYHLTDGTITGRVGSQSFTGLDGEEITLQVPGTDGTSNSVRFRVTVDPGFFGALPPSQQVVEYFSADPGSPNDNHIRPRLQIRNKASTPVPLSEFTMRYWYTSEGLQEESSWLDHVAPPLSENVVTRRFRKLRPLEGADGFFELGFTAAAGNLAANSTTGEIQVRFNKGDWSPYMEAGDYSYDPTKTTYTEWPRVTLYRNGVLVFGREPTPLGQSQIVRALDVFIMDEGFNENNIVKPRMYVVNTGNVTIPAFHLRYSFTVENGKIPVLERWHLPQVTATLENRGGGQWVVDYHFQGVNFGPATVLPDLGGYVSGIHYSDYSAFDKTNDFSNPGSATFVKTTNLEVTFD